MPDQPVFMLANLIIQDAAEYRKYEKGFFPLLKRHGGEFVTFDDGESLMSVDFPDLAGAEAFAERCIAKFKQDLATLKA